MLTRTGHKIPAGSFPAKNRTWLSHLGRPYTPHFQMPQKPKQARRYACDNFGNGTNIHPSVDQLQ
jgi:hypothetical protein